MAERGVIGSVLHNFLGTYISRHTDIGGYWAFGLFVTKIDRVAFDLLSGGGGEGDMVLEQAARLAALRFGEQVRKGGLDISVIRDARLTLTRMPGRVRGEVNGHRRDGYQMRFSVRVESNVGKTYTSERVVFVAPHNPRVEWRSERGDGRTGNASRALAWIFVRLRRWGEWMVGG